MSEKELIKAVDITKKDFEQYINIEILYDIFHELEKLIVIYNHYKLSKEKRAELNNQFFITQTKMLQYKIILRMSKLHDKN